VCGAERDMPQEVQSGWLGPVEIFEHQERRRLADRGEKMPQHAVVDVCLTVVRRQVVG